MRTDSSNGAYQRPIEPDPAEMVARYGARMSLLEGKARLVCARCARQEVMWSSPGQSGEGRGHRTYRGVAVGLPLRSWVFTRARC